MSKSAKELIDRVNNECQAAVKALGYNYRNLDEDSIVSYCKQTVIQRAKQRVKNKELRKGSAALHKFLKEQGFDVKALLEAATAKSDEVEETESETETETDAE